MKKTVSGAAILLAGVVMLMLSVLPHHHHGNHIRFVAVQQCGECHEQLPCSRADHSEEADTDCDLRSLFVLYARSQGPSSQVDDHLHFHGGLSDFFLPSFVVCLADPLVQTTVRYVPFVEPIAFRYAGTQSLLRAPPALMA